jgi:hypothetical protein
MAVALTWIRGWRSQAGPPDLRYRGFFLQRPTAQRIRLVYFQFHCIQHQLVGGKSQDDGIERFIFGLRISNVFIREANRFTGRFCLRNTFFSWRWTFATNQFPVL